MVRVILPELGEAVKSATVTYWYFKVGDSIKENEDLVELTTDKAAFNLPSPASGVLAEIFFREGDTVQSGETLAFIDGDLGT